MRQKLQYITDSCTFPLYICNFIFQASHPQSSISLSLLLVARFYSADQEFQFFPGWWHFDFVICCPILGSSSKFFLGQKHFPFVIVFMPYKTLTLFGEQKFREIKHTGSISNSPGFSCYKSFSKCVFTVNKNVSVIILPHSRQKIDPEVLIVIIWYLCFLSHQSSFLWAR